LNRPFVSLAAAAAAAAVVVFGSVWMIAIIAALFARHRRVRMLIIRVEDIEYTKIQEYNNCAKHDHEEADISSYSSSRTTRMNHCALAAL
jgi:hypothetical protein